MAAEPFGRHATSAVSRSPFAFSARETFPGMAVTKVLSCVHAIPCFKVN